MIVFWEGAFVPQESATVSVFDRGFLFGDGVYEVLPVFAGEPCGWEGHLYRLDRSLHGVGIPDPYTSEQWYARLRELIERNGAGDLLIYIQVTRGTATPQTIRELVPPASLTPNVLMVAVPRTPAPPAPIEAVTLPDNRWGRCDLKVTSLLPTVLLRRQAVAAGAQDVILHRDGRVTEASTSNVFAVIDGQIVTPPCDKGLLHGVTRGLLVELLRTDGQPVVEAEILLRDLRRADEIWLTSSVRELAPVIRLDGRPVGDGSPGGRWRHANQVYCRWRDSRANADSPVQQP